MALHAGLRLEQVHRCRTAIREYVFDKRHEALRFCPGPTARKNTSSQSFVLLYMMFLYLSLCFKYIKDSQFNRVRRDRA